MKEKFFTTKKIAGMALFAAMGVVLALWVHFPIIPSVPFLIYDPADIPIFLGTFMFGPIAGLILTFIVSLLQGLLASGDGFIGILMHFLATGSYALVAGIIYKRNKTFKSALIGILFGSITMIITMIIWNIVLTPIFMGVQRDIVIKLLPAITLFNVIKVSINSLATILLYKRMHKLLNLVFKPIEKKINKKMENGIEEKKEDIDIQK